MVMIMLLVMIMILNMTMMMIMKMMMAFPQAEVKEAESAGRITSIFNSFAKALSRPASKVGQCYLDD